MIAFSGLYLTAAMLSDTPANVAAIADEKTWVVEYPRVIQPYVEDYRRCLNFANRIISGRPDFEEQHRADIPRCADVRTKAVVDSNRTLNGARTTMTADEVDALFDNIGFIHVSRGRDVDDQLRRTFVRAEQRAEEYDATRPKGLVIELRDASVVKSRLEIEGRVTNQTNQTMEAGNAGY